MKKFKKLLLTLCCFTLLFTSCFYLSGCDTAEETKNAINASTEVVPFEYSQSAATNILMSAFTNSLNLKLISLQKMEKMLLHIVKLQTQMHTLI